MVLKEHRLTFLALITAASNPILQREKIKETMKSVLAMEPALPAALTILLIMLTQIKQTALQYWRCGLKCLRSCKTGFRAWQPFPWITDNSTWGHRGGNECEWLNRIAAVERIRKRESQCCNTRILFIGVYLLVDSHSASKRSSSGYIFTIPYPHSHLLWPLFHVLAVPNCITTALQPMSWCTV